MTACPRRPILSGPKIGHLIQVWCICFFFFIIWNYRMNLFMQNDEWFFVFFLLLRIIKTDAVKSQRLWLCGWLTMNERSNIDGLTTVCWGWHKFHVRNHVSEVLSRKKCSSYHLDSKYTNLGSRMQMALEVLLVVHIKFSQRLNLGI